MKIAIFGGTGKLGLAFAQRLQQTPHEVSIGSRDASNADQAAKTINDNVRGMTNKDAAEWCDLAFVSVPYAGHRALLEPMKEALHGKIIVDATVPIDPGNLFQIKTESGRSAAEETAAIVPGSDVFSAFQTISHRVLRKMDVSRDVPVAGNSAKKSQVMDVIRAMGLRPIDAGPIEVSSHLERMTVLLLSINKANHIKEAGITINGI